MSNLNKLNLTKTLEGLKKKEFSSVALVTACFDKIEKCDNKIKAFLLLNKENALNAAKKADEIITREGTLAFEKRPLLGIPYACKDNFCTKDIETTAGSNILKGFIPPYESTVTKKLKNAGAILVGKTNMDAFAHGASTETSDFFTTTNPSDITKVPGGSSGGSAAAVAAHMCTFAIGSDTGGSIRCPASWCGVTGLKPSYGRVSRYGLIAMASSTDSPGPITKTVEDTALVLSIIAGKDPLDATSRKDSNKLLAEGSLKKIKIGKPKSYFEIEFESGVRETIEKALTTFEKQGAEIIDVELLPPHYAVAVYTIIQRSEVSSNLARFDGIRYGHGRTQFGYEAKKRMLLGAYTLSSGYYDEYYKKAQKVRSLIIEDFNRAFEKVDLILGPTMPTVAMDIGAGASSFGEFTDMMQTPGSMAGLPVISIPCGFVTRLPVGMQMIGPMFEESLILDIAHQYQQITDFHKEVAPC